MCGIFGAVSLQGYFDQEQYKQFAALTDLVQYRGPDAADYATYDLKRQGIASPDHFDVFLGHRRLAIIDLSDEGRQPLTDGLGRWILFNGEIFNYLELRDELKQQHVEFRTATDPEAILRVYARYGMEGFGRLNGMWAFLIVDLPERKLVLSRDRFSIKPLYYLEQDGCFYVSSEIKQLLPLVRPKQINRSAIFSYLTQGLLDQGQDTLYENIRQLSPRSYLSCTVPDGRRHAGMYWEYKTSPEYVSPKGEGDAIQRFRELMIDSVRIRLRSDVKVGTLLSGGLDSSTIALISNHLLKADLETFSAVFPDARDSEERFVDCFAARTGIPNTKLMCSDRSLSDGLGRVIWHHDEPLAALTVPAHYRILEKVKQSSDATVVLSGQGGDEGLLGYRKYFFFYLRQLWRNGHPVDAAREFFSSLANGTVVWQFNFAQARRYVRHWQTAPDFLKLQGEPEPVWVCENLVARQIADLERYTVPILTHYEDRNSMAHSLEIRLPFLDHRLIEFLISAPDSLKIRNGWTKYILRMAFPELPAEIRWRKDKQGFLLPEALWIQKEFAPWVQRLFSDSALERWGIIDSPKFLDYYSRFVAGDPGIWYREISRVLFAELWVRIFLEQSTDVAMARELPIESYLV